MELQQQVIMVPGDMVVDAQISPEQWKLFVGQVPRNMRHEELTPFFEPYGELEELFIIRDRNTGEPKGCCFVRYKQRISAERCIEALHDKVVLPGAANRLQISFALQNNGMRSGMNGQTGNDMETKLFIGQLPSTITENDLQAMFGPHGVVREVVILRDRNSGFVRLEADVDNVNRAIAELNGKMLGDSQVPIKVDRAREKSSTSPRHRMMPGMMSAMNGALRYPMGPSVMAYPPGGPVGTWYPQPAQMDRKNTANLPKLFVGGLTQHTTEEQLISLFSPYGQVREAVILRYPNGQSKSSGFIKYSTEEEANLAMNSLSNRFSLSGNNRPLTVRYAGPSNSPAEHKLFVGHLPPHFDENQTQEIFRAFGDIVEVHVMRDPQGQAKGSAFVKFAQRAQAESAIAALNGSTSLNPERPLKVTFANPKNPMPMHHHHMMAQAPLLQQMTAPPQMPGMAMQQGQPSGMLQRGGPNAAMMATGQAAVQSTQDHMQIQHQMPGYYYMPQYFPVQAGTDGTSFA